MRTEIIEVETSPRQVEVEPGAARLRAATAAPLLPRRRAQWPGRILVFADGSPSAGDAFTFAKGLATRSGAEVNVLTVFAPRIPLPNVPDKRGPSRCEQRDRCAAAEQIRAVRLQERQRFDGHVPWPVRLEVGNPVQVIVEASQRVRPDLVVMALGSSDRSIRQNGVATPVCFSRYAEVPVLASSRMSTALPQTAVLFIDRESPDLTLIRAALRCLEEAAVVWVLIYSGLRIRNGTGVKHDKSTLSAITTLIRREAASVSKEIVVRAVYGAGDPVENVLSLARQVGADLIVTPIHGAAGSIRSLLPNIADRLLLTAPCSVLVVPTTEA